MSNILLLTFDPHRDLKAWAQHVSLEQGDEPTECLCLARKQDHSLKPAAYIIPLDNMFKFTAPESPDDWAELIGSCLNIAKVLECPQEKKDLMKIAMFVQDNIDKVFALKPYQGDGKVVAEVEGKLNGRSFTSDVRVH